jgi:hypothetical protein
LPAIAPYESKPGQTLNPSIELIPGESTTFTFPTAGRRELDFTEYAGIGGIQGRLHVIGWVEYLDDTKRIRRMGFCRTYNAETKRYQREEDEDYEYDD